MKLVKIIVTPVLAASLILAIPFVPVHTSANKSALDGTVISKVTSRSAFIPPENDGTTSKVNIAVHEPYVPHHVSGSEVSTPGLVAREAKAYGPGSFSLKVYHHLEKRGSASAPITFGSYWFATAQSGGQEINMLVDTGSADLWIMGPHVPQSHQDKSQVYDPSKSQSSVEMLNERFGLSYGDGSIGMSGPVFQDTFTLGSASILNMPIGSADSIRGMDPGTVKSGILGLAFRGGNSIRPDQQRTFMEIYSSVLDEPVMVCNFKMSGGGSLDFGRVDEKLYQGDLVTLRVDNGTDQKYAASWSSEGMHYQVNGTDLGESDIVFDTGGPGTTGPQAVVNAYYSQISGSHDRKGDGTSWAVPCDANMPDLEFRFREGQIAKIPGKKLIQRDLGSGLCDTWFSADAKLQRASAGHAFFESNVVVFNQDEAAVSWAPKAE